MTEEEWLATETDSESLLKFLEDSRHVSERRLRLFAVTCFRIVWQLLTDESCRAAIQAAEEFAYPPSTAGLKSS
jgi:hypothetical protein